MPLSKRRFAATFRYLRRASCGVLILAAGFVIGSCSDATVTPIAVSTIELTPSTAVVRAGSSVTLTAKPRDATGAVVDVRTLVWSSSDKSIATVSASGIVTALSPGDARIAVSALGNSATATITVTARVVAAVVVTPASLSMRTGASAPLQAQTLDADGVVLTGRTVTWSSSNPAVASVNAQGAVTGITVGAATITATSEGRSGQAAVTVTIPPVQTITVTKAVDTVGVGTERTLTAVLRDATGAVLTGRALAWNSSNIAVASVSSNGVVTGLAQGAVTISASSEGRVGSASITVLARLASTVIVTPSSSTLIVGTTQLLVSQVTDAQGNLITDRPIAFASDAPAVASVSGSGLVSALAPGTARITATSEGKSGTASITVIPVPVATVQVTPLAPALIIGASQQLTAVARSAGDVILSGRTVTWTSGAPSIATVSSTGLVTGVAPGVAIVLATIDGVTSLATVTVSLPTIVSITLTPLDPGIVVLGSVQLTATPRDAGGTALAGRTVTWTSADESIAFVSSAGLVVGFKVGTVRITATSEGVSVSTLVTVR